jgi:hypothetical protein
MQNQLYRLWGLPKDLDLIDVRPFDSVQRLLSFCKDWESVPKLSVALQLDGLSLLGNLICYGLLVTNLCLLWLDGLY